MICELKNPLTATTWQEETQRRYLGGEWSSEIFRDLVVASIHEHGDRVLDIGCGHGFDDDRQLQESIAEECSRFVGVEPDHAIDVPDYFDEVNRSILEDAPIEPQSIDVAYSVFVLEHVADAAKFWQCVDRVLAPGGVFWGFTVDGRHPFRVASDTMEWLKIKDVYLNRIQGQRGEDRYENYPTHYRANTPASISRHVKSFGEADYLSLHRPGQLDYYFPRMIRPLTRTAERIMMATKCPGSVLVVRVQKQGKSISADA